MFNVASVIQCLQPTWASSLGRRGQGRQHSPMFWFWTVVAILNTLQSVLHIAPLRVTVLIILRQVNHVKCKNPVIRLHPPTIISAIYNLSIHTFKTMWPELSPHLCRRSMEHQCTVFEGFLASSNGANKAFGWLGRPPPIKKSPGSPWNTFYVGPIAGVFQLWGPSILWCPNHPTKRTHLFLPCPGVHGLIL